MCCIGAGQARGKVDYFAATKAVGGGGGRPSQVQQLPQLRSLRKLGFTMKATAPSLGTLENLELEFVPELDQG